MNISIRSANLGDAPSIHALIESTYRGESAKKGWTFESDLIDGARLQEGEIETCMADNNQKFFVASTEANQIIGVICVTKDGDWVEFGKFSVDPAFQGKSIGKRLIEAVSEFVKNQWSAKSLKLMVITKRVELVNFYLRQGFKPTGEIKDFVKIHPYVILKDPTEALKIMVMEREV